MVRRTVVTDGRGADAPTISGMLWGNTAEDGDRPPRSASQRRRVSAMGFTAMGACLLALLSALLTTAEAYSERKPFGSHESHMWAKDSTHTKRMPVASVSPLVGPASGGTKVTLQPIQQLPEDQKFFYCQFGDTTVIADSFYTLRGRPAIVCTAPKGTEKKSVPLRLSYDGLTFTDTGVDYHYHSELSIAQVSPAAGTLAGGIEVMLKVRGKLVQSSFNDTWATTATCRFDETEVPAKFENLEGDELYSKFKCVAPAVVNVGVVDLRVSLDGQSYSKNRATYTYLYSAQAEEGESADLEMHQMLRKFGEPTEVAPTVFQTTFYDFYGFYGFYEFSFYDFYGLVRSEYAADADEGEGVNDVSELPAASTTIKISELCMVALTPAVGPATGGTRVTLKLAGAVPEGQQLFFCKFGSTVVPADSFYFTADSASPAVVCTAPPGTAREHVTLRFSLDGEQFTAAGATFYYHSAVKVDMLMPSAASTVGGTNVMLQLSENPLEKGFSSDTVTVPTTCKFDGIEVPGEYLHALHGEDDAPRIVCPTPPMDVGVVDLYVSLDGQSYNARPAPFTVLLGMPEEPDFGFSRQDRALPGIMREGPFVADEEYERGFYEFYHFYSTFYNFFYFYQDFYGATDTPEAPVALPKLPTYVSPAVPTVFDYLPFSPDYCAFFDTGPDATLEVLKLSDGVLSPVFNPSTTVFFAAVPKAVASINVLAISADPLATVRVNGEKIPQGAVAVRGGKKSNDIDLSVGENLVTTTVTAQDGKTKEYSVVAVRLAGTDSSLSYLAVHPNTTEELGFEPETLNYFMTVRFFTKQTFVVARPADRDATIVVKINGQEGQIMTSEVSPLLDLDVGVNTIEVIVYAEDGIAITTYTITVRRLTGSELIDLEVFAPDLSNKLEGFAFQPAFAAETFTYQLYAPTIATVAFVRPTSRDADATITMTTSHVPVNTGRRRLSAAGCDAAAGQNSGDFVLQQATVSDSICLVFGTNTFEVTVKNGANPAATYTLIVTRPAADALLINLFAIDALSFEDPKPYITDTDFTPPKESDGTIDSLSEVQYVHVPYNYNKARIEFHSSPLAYRMWVYKIGSNTAAIDVTTGVGFTDTVLDKCGLIDGFGYHVSILGSDRYTRKNYTVYINRQARPEHGQLSDFGVQDGYKASNNKNTLSFDPAFTPAVLSYNHIIIRNYQDGSVSAIGTSPHFYAYAGYANVTLSGIAGENLLPNGAVTSYTLKTEITDLYGPDGNPDTNDAYPTKYQRDVAATSLNLNGAYSSGPHRTKYAGTYSAGEMVINPIKVKVIACDNFTINTYVFNAKRSDGDNSKLCGITADRGAGINPFNGGVADQTLYIPSYEDGLGGTAQIKTTTCDPYADVSWTYKENDYAGSTYYGYGSQDGSATFPLPLPAHTGTTQPEVTVYVHVTAQNGAATTTYKLKVVHVIGKTATLDGVIVRGYTCATYPCTGNCAESSCWSYPGTGLTRTATVPGMETKSARRALAADEASTYGGETSNATRRMLLATPSCDGSGCQTHVNVRAEQVFETFLPFEEIGDIPAITALDEDPHYGRRSRALQAVTTTTVSMSPGGVPLAQTQTGTLPWQYGFVTITPLCTDTSCSSVTVDGKVSGGHNVESPLVPVNGEINFLPGSSSIAVFVKPHDSTAPAKEYYMKLSRQTDNVATIKELGIMGIDLLSGAKLPGTCYMSGQTETHLNPAGVATEGEVIMCNVPAEAGRASVIPYTDNPYAEFTIDQFRTTGSQTPFLYVKYGAEADPPYPDAPKELAFEANGPIRLKVTATDQVANKPYYLYIYRGMLSTSALKNITVESYEHDAAPKVPTDTQASLPFGDEPWTETYHPNYDGNVEPGNLIPNFNETRFQEFPDATINRLYSRAYYGARMPVLDKWARIRIIPEDRLASITVNGVECKANIVTKRSGLPDGNEPLYCKQLPGAAGLDTDGLSAAYTAIVQMPYPDALILNIVVKSADKSTETRYQLSLYRNNPHLYKIEFTNTSRVDYYDYECSKSGTTCNFRYPMGKKTAQPVFPMKARVSGVKESELPDWEPAAPYEEDEFNLKCLAPKLGTMDGTMNAFAQGYGYESFPTSYAEMPLVTLSAPIIDRSVPTPKFDASNPNNFDYVMELDSYVNGLKTPNTTNIDIYTDRYDPEYTQVRLNVLAVDAVLSKMYTVDVARQRGDVSDFMKITLMGEAYVAVRVDPNGAKPEGFEALDLTDCSFAIKFPSVMDEVVVTATMFDADASYFFFDGSGQRLGLSDTAGFPSGTSTPSISLREGKNVFGMIGIAENPEFETEADLCVFKLASDIALLKEITAVDAVFDDDGALTALDPPFTPYPEFEEKLIMYDYAVTVFKYEGMEEPKVRETTSFIIVPYEEKATIVVNGLTVANDRTPKSVTLSKDDITNVVIDVTAPDGEGKKQYKVIVRRSTGNSTALEFVAISPPENNALSSAIELLPFPGKPAAYFIDVPAEVQAAKLFFQPFDPATTVLFNDDVPSELVTDQVSIGQSKAFDLKDNSNLVQVKVISESGKFESTYDVHVYRSAAPRDNLKLKTMRIIDASNKPTTALEPEFDPETLGYTLFSGTDSRMTLRVEAEGDATVSVRSTACTDGKGGGWENATSLKIDSDGNPTDHDRKIDSTGECSPSGVIELKYGMSVIEITVSDGTFSTMYRILAYRTVPNAGPVNDKFNYKDGVVPSFLRTYATTQLAELMMLEGLNVSGISGYYGPDFSPQAVFYYGGSSIFSRIVTLAARPFYKDARTFINGLEVTDGSKVQTTNHQGQNFALVRTEGDGFQQDVVGMVDVATGLEIDLIQATDNSGASYRAVQFGSAGTCISSFDVYTYSNGCDEYRVLLPFSSETASVTLRALEHTSEVKLMKAYSDAFPDFSLPETVIPYNQSTTQVQLSTESTTTIEFELMTIPPAGVPQEKRRIRVILERLTADEARLRSLKVFAKQRRQPPPLSPIDVDEPVEEFRLVPPFSSDVEVYTVTVPKSMHSLVVQPTSLDPMVRSIFVADGNTKTGSESPPLVLTGSSAIGSAPQIVTIVVSSQDGTQKTYTLRLVRQPSNNAFLSNLKVYAADFLAGTSAKDVEYPLSPTFVNSRNPDTPYTSSVPHNVVFVKLEFETEIDAGFERSATVAVEGDVSDQSSPNEYKFYKSGSRTADVGPIYVFTDAIQRTPAPNNIRVVVTAEDQKTRLIYSVSVSRAPSKEARVKNMVFQTGLNEWDAYSSMLRIYPDPAFLPGVREWWTYPTEEVTSGTVLVEALANQRDPWPPSGAFVKVEGAGALGAKALSALSNVSGTIGTDDANRILEDGLLVGANPVSVFTTAQDGATLDQYVLNVTRLGKPIFGRIRVPGVGVDEARTNPRVQRAILDAILKLIQGFPFQAFVTSIQPGSVVIDFNIYILIRTVREPRLSLAEKAQVEQDVQRQVVELGDQYVSTLLGADGTVIDLGIYGGIVELDVIEVSTPLVARSGPCPKCPTGFRSLRTEDPNNPGLYFCKCIRLPEDDAIDAGEIVAAAIVAVLVFFVGLFLGYYYFRREKTTNAILAAVIARSGQDDRMTTTNVGQLNPEFKAVGSVVKSELPATRAQLAKAASSTPPSSKSGVGGPAPGRGPLSTGRVQSRPISLDDDDIVTDPDAIRLLTQESEQGELPTRQAADAPVSEASLRRGGSRR